MVVNAVTVCVGYDDLLAITLPRMTAVFERICVVTDQHDCATVLVAESRDNVFAHQTDAFYRDGATFNKGAAVEEGFTAVGRDGWMCVIDADLVLPLGTDLSACEPGFLYTARRRMCYDPGKWDGSEDWSRFTLSRDREWAGYLQVFHADDPVLRKRPWYDLTWRHAGGCDSSFQGRWKPNRKRLLPFKALHLGAVSLNWWGRQTKRLDGSMPAGAVESRRLRDEMVYHRRRNRRAYDWERIHDPS